MQAPNCGSDLVQTPVQESHKSHKCHKCHKCHKSHKPHESHEPHVGGDETDAKVWIGTNKSPVLRALGAWIRSLTKCWGAWARWRQASTRATRKLMQWQRR